ncbi:MAG: hypothetical protein AVDCRST_MAG28-2301, partial [uncultured Rubrobacteraceae bacterium]
ERADEQACGTLQAPWAQPAAICRRRTHLSARRCRCGPRGLWCTARYRGLRVPVRTPSHGGTGCGKHHRRSGGDEGLGARNGRRTRYPGPRGRRRPRHDGRVCGLPV